MMRIPLLLFAIWCTAWGVQGQSLVWHTGDKVMNIADRLLFMENHDHRLSFSDVVKSSMDTAFRRLNTPVVNFGFCDDDFWFKITIDNQSSAAGILEFSQHFIPRVDMYTQDSAGKTAHYLSGFNVPFFKKPIRHHTQAFYLLPGLHTYFFDVHIYGQSAPVKVWDAVSFGMESNARIIVYGLFIGLMLYVIINSIIVFFSLHYYTYLHYAVQIAFYLFLASTVMDGFIYYFFPGIELLKVFKYAPPLSQINSMLYFVFFIRLKTSMPRYYKLGMGFVIFFIIYFLITLFLPTKTALNTNPLTAILLFMIVSYLSYKSYILGNRLGLYFLVGYLLFFILLVIEAFYAYFGRPGYIIKISHVTLGFLLESFVLLLALSKRFELEKQEAEDYKTHTQKLLLAQTQENERIVRQQNAILEEKVSLRTKELNESMQLAESERRKSDALLLNILPAEVADELKHLGKSTAQNYEMATVLFADIKDFTSISTRFKADTIIKELDYIFGAFDKIIEKYNIEKIKVIGDAYMCAGGIPIANNTNALDVVTAAMEMQEFMKKMQVQRRQSGEQEYSLRIGIHTGPLVAGIIGIKKFTYDIWGDTVNLASRLEEAGEENKVNISEYTCMLIQDQFDCTYRGMINVKGKGDTKMYFVDKAKS